MSDSKRLVPHDNPRGEWLGKAFRIEDKARENPAALTDEEIVWYSQQGPEYKSAARDFEFDREKALAKHAAVQSEAALRRDAEARAKAVPPIAKWRKGETEEEFLARSGHLPLSARRVYGEVKAICEALNLLQDFAEDMNERNIERNARIAALEARLAAAEARLGGHQGGDLEKRVEGLEEQRSIVAERIRAIEDRPALAYRGIWQAGADYRQGEFCTWGGSMWHCNAATRQRPGDGASRDWTLCVKKGTDGRNGKDATA